MKTLFNAIISSSLAIILTVTTVFATGKTTPSLSPGNKVKFNRVSVSGNVEVIIKQADFSQIAYADDNSGRVKVNEKGGKLSITSDSPQTAKIILYVTDIYRIQACDNAIVSTENVLNVKYLQIFLSGRAEANIHSKTDGLYTVLENKSRLALSGSTQEHALAMDSTPTLIRNAFASDKTTTFSISDHQNLLALAR